MSGDASANAHVIWTKLQSMSPSDVELLMEIPLKDLTTINLDELRFSKTHGIDYYHDHLNRKCKIITYSPGLNKYGCFNTLDDYDRYIYKKRECVSVGSDFELIFNDSPQRIIITVPSLLKNDVNDIACEIKTHLMKLWFGVKDINYVINRTDNEIDNDIEVMFTGVILPNAKFVIKVLESLSLESISKGVKITLNETKDFYRNSTGFIKSSIYRSSWLGHNYELDVSFVKKSSGHKTMIGSYADFIRTIKPQWFRKRENVSLDALYKEFADLYDYNKIRNLNTSFKRYFHEMLQTSGYHRKDNMLCSY